MGTTDAKIGAMPAAALDDLAERDSKTGTRAERLGAVLERRLEAAKAAGRCEDWELDEVEQVEKGVFGIKVGVYPWGKTILYGTWPQLLRDVDGILREITQERFHCPACGTAAPLGFLSEPGPGCRCGARFFVVGVYQAGGGVIHENCWPALRAALLATGGEAWKAVGAIEAGHGEPGDLFSGVWDTQAWGTTVHVVAPEARALEARELPDGVVLAELLVRAGFEEHSRVSFGRDGRSTDHRWFEGEAAGEPVAVTLPEVFYGPDDVSTELRLGIDEEPSRLYGALEAAKGAYLDDLVFTVTDELCDEWPDYCLYNGRRGAWQVSDGYPDDESDISWMLMATYQGAVPVDAGADWLRETLDDGARACAEVAEAFLAEFDVEGRLGELIERDRDADRQTRKSRQRQLEGLLSGDEEGGHWRPTSRPWVTTPNKGGWTEPRWKLPCARWRPTT